MTGVRQAYEGLGPTRAFLPSSVPPASFDGPLQPFSDAARAVPEHYARDAGGVRRWLDGERDFGDSADAAEATAAAIDAVDALAQHELEALGCALAVLTHAYRWDTMPPHDVRFEDDHVELPPAIDRLWRHTAARLGQRPVGTMYTLHAANWTGTTLPPGSPYDPRRLTLDDMTLAFGWLWGDAARDLEIFSLSIPLLEARAATALEGAVWLVEACERRDGVETIHALDTLLEGVDDMASAFLGTIRTSRVDPTRWLELVQPHAGWAVGDDAGASGLQLGALRAIDAVLGVDDVGRMGAGYQQMRPLLLPRHRAFLDALDAARPVVTEAKPRWGKLAARRFDECARSLQRLRRAHRARGAQYLRAGQEGDSRRLSSGLRTEYRSEDDPVVGFEIDMQERIDQLGLVMFGIAAGEENTPEAAFRFLDDDERARVLAAASARTLSAGESLVQAGEVPTELWVVDDGVLAVRTADGRRVGRVWPGQVAGELSLIDPRPAAVSLEAEVETVVLAVAHKTVLDVVAADADLARRFYQSLAVAIADKLRAQDEVVAELVAATRE